MMLKLTDLNVGFYFNNEQLFIIEVHLGQQITKVKPLVPPIKKATDWWLSEIVFLNINSLHCLVFLGRQSRL